MAAFVASFAALAAPAHASRCGVPSWDQKRGKPLVRQITCLVNRTRAARGLPRLRRSGKLALAARSYARWMTHRDVFSHYGDGSPASRAASAGYMRSTADWTVGETLAFSRRSDGPWVVDAWLASPSHRAVLLNPRFREIGVGAARGAPYEGVAGGVTVAANFGVR